MPLVLARENLYTHYFIVEIICGLRSRGFYSSHRREINTLSQFDGCCGDDEAGTESKVESEQQSDYLHLFNHSAEMDDQVVEGKNITVVERRDSSLQEQFSEVSCEEPDSALVSSVKTSGISNETQVSVEEQLQKDSELDVKKERNKGKQT
ncbi:hypothetical protein CRYUN_Cryun26dG0105100 [Craigia yunnanensis]